jgi:UDP-N-acetyl-D-mannosaminuronic acid transferase (WecB/TagA/CpsF family)
LLAGADCSSHDFENDPIENERVLERFRKAAPGILFVAQPRAPRPVQRLGLEWLFPLMIKPRGLCGRYLIGYARFVALVALQFLRRTVRAVDGMRAHPLKRDDFERESIS